MLDIKLVRENPELIKKDLEKRQDNEKIKFLTDLLKKDIEWRKIKGEVDNLRRKRNELSQQVNKLMKSGKKAEAKKIIIDAKKILPQIEKKEKNMQELREKVDYYLKRLPNILHKSVPNGKDDSENVEVRKWGKPKKKETWLKSHAEVAEGLGANFERSAKTSGKGFYFIQGELAMLNQALIRFAIDHMRKQNFTYVETPYMIRKSAVEGVTDLDAFSDVVYKIEGEDLYMIATSEHALAAQFSDETIKRKDLPLKVCAYSMCFRKEVGTRSVDEKGFFRTHQFNKVEMFVFCQPKDSWQWHENMIKFSEDIFQALEIPYQVVNVCTGDIGSIASKKYDLNVWFPRQQAYKEVVSCSNCTDYQARRLNIKFEGEDGTHQLVHTLNNTALATSRALVAILETFQNKDGSVTVPKVLQKYMGGLKKIVPIKAKNF